MTCREPMSCVDSTEVGKTSSRCIVSWQTSGQFMIMQGTVQGSWRSGHEESTCHSRGQAVRSERRTSAAAGRQGRTENRASPWDPYLYMGKRQGRCQKAITPGDPAI